MAGHRSWRGLSNVHPESACEGQPCTIHHPSDHHMATWPQIWRNDRGIMERQCPHGIGHPDPDDIRIVNREDPGIHGCDGCCVSRPVEKRLWSMEEKP